MPIDVPGQVLAYLLCSRLAHVHLLADTPDTRNSATGKVGSEEFRCLTPVAVEPGWRLGYAGIRRGCSGGPLAGHGDRGLGSNHEAPMRFATDTGVLASYAMTAYPASCYVWLGDYRQAQADGRVALAAHQAAPDGSRSPTPEAIARIDLAIAVTALGEPDEGADLGRACARFLAGPRLGAVPCRRPERGPGSALPR